MRDFLSEEAVMLMFNVSRTTLWALRKKGLPHYKVGSLLRYDLNEVIEWFRVHPEAEDEAKGEPVQ